MIRNIVMIVAAAAVAATAPGRDAPANKAQSPSGLAAAESARVAREAFARASGALRAADTAAAHRELRRAAMAWPTQPAYLWGRAVTAAYVDDTAEARAALSDLAALGLGRDLREDSTFSRRMHPTDFAGLVERHEANRQPMVRSVQRMQLVDSTFWPEGIDVDPRTGRYFVTSVRHRTIAEVNPDGRVRELLPRHQPGIGSILAVRVDTARAVLWAAMSGLPQMERYQASDSGVAGLLRIRLADGVIERRWDLTDGSRHVLGDVAIGPHGDVFVSDSYRPYLYRLRPGADSLERLIHPLFRSLQGIAPSPDGRYLYVADYSHGILRIDLRRYQVIRLPDAPNSTSLGCDGLVWFRNSLIAVQNGVAPARVMAFVLDSTGSRILRADVLDRNATVADEPTIGTVSGDSFVYVANSHWRWYTGNGVLRPNAQPAPPVLLALPLPPDS
jgi:sugar lactone lactonase YvrE